jgi:hypothetical protein
MEFIMSRGLIELLLFLCTLQFSLAVWGQDDAVLAFVFWSRHTAALLRSTQCIWYSTDRVAASFKELTHIVSFGIAFMTYDSWRFPHILTSITAVLCVLGSSLADTFMYVQDQKHRQAMTRMQVEHEESIAMIKELSRVVQAVDRSCSNNNELPAAQ